MGGLMSVTGYPDGEPLKAGISLGDYMGGYNGVIAILAALYYRTVSGEGQAIDISMQDGIWAMVFPDRADYFDTHIVPKRIGNKLSSSAPFGAYNAKDGYVVICTITDPQWQKVLQAMGREDLSGEPRYVTRENRTKNMDGSRRRGAGMVQGKNRRGGLRSPQEIPGALFASAHF